jgi:hypothetical protein
MKNNIHKQNNMRFKGLTAIAMNVTVSWACYTV